jgi:hypothetical protein
MINLKPMRITAELEYECVDKDEKECQQCQDRFKCWTSRTTVLPVTTMSIRQDTIYGHGDEFEFTAELPRCFRCGNMVGSKVTLRADVDGQLQIFNGICIAHFIRAEGTSPMTIEVKGVREIF